MKRLMMMLLVAGVLMAGLGYAMGGDNDVYWEHGRAKVAKREVKRLLVTEPLRFTALELRASVADVRVTEGDAFRIEAEYQDGQEPKYELDGDVLRVYDTGAQSRALRFSMGVHIFSGNRVTVTLPRGTQLADADLHVDVGALSVEGLRAERVTAGSNTGTLRIRDVTAQTLEAKTGVGEASLAGLATGGLTVRSGTGEVSVQGALRGVTDVSTGVGSVSVETSLNATDYQRVYAHADVGETSVQPEWNPALSAATENSVSAACGVGDVRIRFGR